MIKIFDSAMHPTINGTWLNPKYNNYCNLEYLIQDMKKNAIYKALALGLKGIGGYQLEKYIEWLKPYPQFIPIAFCDTVHSLVQIKKLGYKGIKIHPRIAKLENKEEAVITIINEANQLNLKVIYCGFLGASDYFIQHIGNNKLIFLHTGGKNVLNAYNTLINFPNIVLDFSYTMCKSPELKETIKQLFNLSPHRICIGSDQPEVRLDELRQAFEELTQDLPLEEKEKIAYKNIENFFND